MLQPAPAGSCSPKCPRKGRKILPQACMLLPFCHLGWQNWGATRLYTHTHTFGCLATFCGCKIAQGLTAELSSTCREEEGGDTPGSPALMQRKVRERERAFLESYRNAASVLQLSLVNHHLRQEGNEDLSHDSEPHPHAWPPLREADDAPSFPRGCQVQRHRHSRVLGMLALRQTFKNSFLRCYLERFLCVFLPMSCC